MRDEILSLLNEILIRFKKFKGRLFYILLLKIKYLLLIFDF